MKNALLPLKRLRNSSILKAAAVTVAAVFLFSCAAVPEKAGMLSSAELLPEEANIIISAGVENNMELIEPVLSIMGAGLPEDLSKTFLEKTDRIWAGLELVEDSGNGAPGFKSSMAAAGVYPKGLIEWSLGWSADWQKAVHKPELEGNYEMAYWDSAQDANQLAFPNDEFILASGGDLLKMLDSWALGSTASVDEWVAAERGADITLMSRGLSKEQYGSFVPELVKVPIESLLLSLKRIDDDYLIQGRFHMDSAMNAFLFATIFRTMIITAKTDDGKRRFTNLKEIKIDKEGSDVVLSGLKIKVAEAVETEIKWLTAAGKIEVGR